MGTPETRRNSPTCFRPEKKRKSIKICDSFFKETPTFNAPKAVKFKKLPFFNNVQFLLKVCFFSTISAEVGAVVGRVGFRNMSQTIFECKAISYVQFSLLLNLYSDFSWLSLHSKWMLTRSSLKLPQVSFKTH